MIIPFCRSDHPAPAKRLCRVLQPSRSRCFVHQTFVGRSLHPLAQARIFSRNQPTKQSGHRRPPAATWCWNRVSMRTKPWKESTP